MIMFLIFSFSVDKAALDATSKLKIENDTTISFNLTYNKQHSVFDFPIPQLHLKLFCQRSNWKIKNRQKIVS